MNSGRVKARDAKRLSDVHTIELAMNFYANENNGNFPSSAGTWKCLGDTETQVSCPISGATGLTALNVALAPFLPAIPRNPTTVCGGNAYGYHSNHVPTGPVAGSPGGAYLFWYAEGPPAMLTCGSPFYSSNSCGTICARRVGDATP